MTREKFKDIIDTMVEYNLIDPYEAMLNPQYLVNRVNDYIKAANIARKMMNMEPLI